MKLVVDTNILISGSLWHELPARPITAMPRGGAQLGLSPPMLLELTETLQREKFAPRLAGRGETPDTLTARFRAGCREVVPARIAAPPGLRDPDDAHVLACAAAAAADAIVTDDMDLLVLESFEGIPIITARRALEWLGIATE